tara:strand:- start:447 stop:1217 length:771 start_codon:yes stop_codon:yes gene_type:complete
MKSIFKYLIIIKIIWLTFIVNTYANVTGAAEMYKVIMRKVELCTGSTGIDNCDNAVVVGSGDKVVDIASVGAGAAAASYGDPALLPLGTTYTHMRVTIDRKFRIKSSEVLDPAGAAEGCVTQTTTDGNYGTNEAARKYTHKPVVSDGKAIAAAQAMTIYMENDSYSLCDDATCSGTSSGSNDYSDPTYITYQETHDSDTSDDHVMVYLLTNPYTVALVSPTIDISFGTQDAVGAFTVSSTLCAMYGAEPRVTITIK